MDKKVGIIGYGSMGGMIARKTLEAGVVTPDKLFVANRTASKVEPLKKRYSQVTVCSNDGVAANADIIFVCVRTGDMKSVFQDIAPRLDGTKHVISLNGSLGLDQIAKVFDGKVSIVIPAVTAEVGMSLSLVCHNSTVTEEDMRDLSEILQSFGNVIELPESEIGIGSELTSCMPGLLAAIVEVLADRALSHTKLPKNQVIDMIFGTMLGTARLALEQRISPEDLVGRVATPGGITEEGVKVLRRDLPAVADEVFRKTIEKRRITADAAAKTFGA